MADRVITDRMVADHRLSQISTASSTNSKRAKAHVGPWQLGRTLGRGSSGRVRLAKHTETGKLAAVKIVPKAQTPDSQMGKASESYGIEREVIIMKLIEHPNIMGLFDVWENKGELYLVLEYIEGGELFDYLISRGRLSEREAIHYFRQICYGVDYCHSFNICHRDLKPENLLLDKHRNIKIADFGMAALEANGRLLETSCGSPHYASPEIVSGKTYHGAPSDIWSCGIILFALLTGHLPFDDDNIRQLLLKVQAGKFSMPSSLSVEARDLISRMLVVDPMQRICMRDILDHPLLRKYPPRHIPAENVGKKMPRVDVSQRIGHIDREILRNLQTLWPHSSKETLISQLRQQSPNTEKIFYALLVRFRQRHGLSSRDSVPRNKSVASVKSMRSSKSVRSLASLNSKPGSMKSLKSMRSSRSARSIMSTRRRRSPTKQASTGNSGKTRSSTPSTAGVTTTTTTNAASAASAATGSHANPAKANDHTDLFAQILDQAFNSSSKDSTATSTAARASTTANTAKPTSAAANMTSYQRRTAEAATYTIPGTNTNAMSSSNANVLSPRKKITTPVVAGSTVPPSAALGLRPSTAPAPGSHYQSTASSTDSPFRPLNMPLNVPQTAPGSSDNTATKASVDYLKAKDHKPNTSFTNDAFDALNMDFDFSNSPFGLSAQSEQTYLLPMIFEEDRFADAIEEEMEQKIYSRGNENSKANETSGLRNKPGDDSQLRIINLVAGESFLSYQPSPAAAAIGAPVRPAPKAPNGPRSMPGRKPVPIYTDSDSQEGTSVEKPRDTNESRTPLATLKSSSKAPEKAATYSGAATAQKPSGSIGAMESLRIPKRDEWKSAAQPSSDASSAHKDKPKMSWIRRLTPRIVSRKSSKGDEAKNVQPASKVLPSPQSAPAATTTTAAAAASSSSTSAMKTSPNIGASTAPRSAPRSAPAARQSRTADVLVDKENILPHQEKITSQPTERSHRDSHSARTPFASQVEEPRQNWFMKMLSSPAQSSVRVLQTSCESIELRAIILEILNEWAPHGLAIYNDGARGDPVVVAVLRNNSLRLKAARVGIEIKPSSSSASSARLVLQKGSRTSFTAFSNEMSRRLRENNVLNGAN